MREVLRDARTEGRVLLSEVVRPGTFGVGVLEGLAAEVTIDDGVLYLSSAVEGRVVRRAPADTDQAALLALATVEDWRVQRLPSIDNMEALEDAIHAAVVAAGLDPSGAPLPVRIQGTLGEFDIHVLDGSCPIANPDGPPPARVTGTGTGAETEAILVGFYAEGQGGVLTHHGQRTHLHAILSTPDGPVTGHVDSIEIQQGARLQIGVPVRQ